MDSKVATQQGGKIAKKGEVCLEELLNMQDLTEGKRFEYRVLPLVPKRQSVVSPPVFPMIIDDSHLFAL